MDCEDFCRQFWKKSDGDPCMKCHPVMRALLMSLHGGPGQKVEATSELPMERGEVQRVVKIDEMDTVVDRLEWNALHDALTAVGKTEIPREQVEAIELILTEIKRRGYL